MLKGLQYIAISVLVVILNTFTQHQLQIIQGLSTDSTYYTTQLAELSRLEKELLQFRVDAAAMRLSSSAASKESLNFSFDILWSRVNTEYNRKLDPPIDALSKHMNLLGELSKDLTTIEGAVSTLKPGDDAGWRTIDDTLARTAERVREATTDAYAELYKRATVSTVAQRQAIKSFTFTLHSFLLIILCGLILLLWQLRKVGQLNSALNDKEAAITRLATHDPLTDLHNRRHFDSVMSAVDSRTCTGDLHIAIIDLDGFKQVNDTRGHAWGDAVLKSVAERLKSNLVSARLIARLGGDEFAVLFDAAYVDVMKLSESIISEISKPVFFEEEHVSVGASIGIAAISSLEPSASRMLKEADLALYCAKARGRGCAVHYDTINKSASFSSHSPFRELLADAFANATP